MTKNRIAKIRKFNRYYTNILGLLDQHILESDLSLSEVRVLHEIDQAEQCTSKMLSDILCVDTGYLSRILKKLEKMGYIGRKRSVEDGRAQKLYLEPNGREKMKELNQRSDKQILKILKPISDGDKHDLVKNMTCIETILSNGKNINLKDINIRTDIRPGDVGNMIYMHGQLYSQEYDYSIIFESYVAQSAYEFLSNYKSGNDRLWIAEHNENIVGYIGIVGHGERAQLRWFLVDPYYRGIGLGKILLQEALNFAKMSNYKSIYLDTTNDLEQAIAIYTKVGFKKVAEKKNNSWRKDLIELEFEMDLV